MDREIHIISYFALPTDVAGELRGWPEFVGGHDYTADLRDSATGETVGVQLIEAGEERYVAVRGSGAGLLFDRVVGRVIYALATHSDNLLIERTD